MNATDFECPVCGAKPGQRCTTATGKLTPVTHGRRKTAALDQHRDDDSAAHRTEAHEQKTSER